MSSKIITILGGARSGKSTFAEELARGLDKRTIYLATAQKRDEEMIERIAKHQASRLKTWETMEEPFALAQAIQVAGERGDVLLIDCLTLFLSNLLLENLGELGSEENPKIPIDLEEKLLEAVREVIRAAEKTGKIVIFVSNEVGSGIVPLYNTARFYRDVVGRANQLLAQASTKVFSVHAGIALELKRRGSSVQTVCEELLR